MRKKLAMKICAVAMSVAMVGTLAGCGNDAGTSSEGSTGNSEPGESQGGQDSEDSNSEESQGGEETPGSEYDFGGQVVKVYGGNWNKLDPDSQDDNTVYENAAALVEQKYNVKFQWTKPDGYEGYNQHEFIINSLNNGEGCVDILSADMDAAVTLMGGGYVADITADVDKLQVGSLYTDAASWGGHCYGLTFDNVGDTYTLVYSRKYLQDIGMTVTPTEKFMKGEWSYDECLAYLKELQSKLPDNTYAIGVHYFHWACMAPAANGVPGVSSDGHLGILDEAYIEAMEFYNTLIAEGVAAPITFGYDDDGNINSESLTYGTGAMQAEGTSESPRIVITRIETWEMSGLEENIGEFGIVYWPWGSNVTCEGDYTTLSDNYYTAQAYWGPTFIVKDAPDRTGIDAVTLLQMAIDYYEAADPVGVTAMREAYEAEQAGLEPEIGFERGQARKFSTQEDIELFDWGHTRVTYDWSKSFDDGDIVNIWMNAAYIIDTGDGRAHGESYYQAGYQNMKDLGLVE